MVSGWLRERRVEAVPFIDCCYLIRCLDVPCPYEEEDRCLCLDHDLDLDVIWLMPTMSF